MIFTVKKASDWEYKRFIEISNLEELKNFVLSFDCKDCVIYWDDMELLIYDDWIE